MLKSYLTCVKRGNCLGQTFVGVYSLYALWRINVISRLFVYYVIWSHDKKPPRGYRDPRQVIYIPRVSTMISCVDKIYSRIIRVLSGDLSWSTDIIIRHQSLSRDMIGFEGNTTHNIIKADFVPGGWGRGRERQTMALMWQRFEVNILLLLCTIPHSSSLKSSDQIIISWTKDLVQTIRAGKREHDCNNPPAAYNNRGVEREREREQCQTAVSGTSNEWVQAMHIC